MANPEHGMIVQQGAAAIRKWREEHPNERLDLREADVREGTLRGADLHEADWRGAASRVFLPSPLSLWFPLSLRTLRGSRRFWPHIAPVPYSGTDAWNPR
jgi:hypothetical protein